MIFWYVLSPFYDRRLQGLQSIFMDILHFREVLNLLCTVAVLSIRSLWANRRTARSVQYQRHIQTSCVQVGGLLCAEPDDRLTLVGSRILNLTRPMFNTEGV